MFSILPIIIIVIETIIVTVILFNAYYVTYKSPYHYASKHIPAYSVFILLLLFLFMRVITENSYQELWSSTNRLAVFLNIISNHILVAAFLIVLELENWIKNKYEDKEKLCIDYQALVNRYHKDRLLTVCNGNGTKITYPIFVLGTGEIEIPSADSEKMPENISIKDSQDFYKPPALLESHLAEILRVHDASAIYNSVNIRVKGLEFSGNKLELTTERTYYYYSLITNRAADYEWDDQGVYVRELYEPGPRMTSLEHSLLSNHLGFHVIITTKDGYIAFIKRGKNVSTEKELYGLAIQGSLKGGEYGIDDQGRFSAVTLKESIFGEINDELSIERNGIKSIHIIGAYRDYVECGKPQLLLYAEVDKTAVEIIRGFEYANQKADNENEYVPVSSREKRRYLLQKKMKKDGDNLIWLKKGQLEELEFLVNGIQFNGPDDKNVEKGFVRYDSEGNKQQNISQKLDMVPSGLASVYLFKEYCKGH